MADIKQKINDLRDEIARLEKKAKSEDTAQKVVIGGMLLSLARKNKDIAKMTLAWIDENVTRKNDLDRIKPIIAELNEFLDPTTAIIQDEQKENSKNDEVVEAVDDDGKDDKQQENPVVVEAVDVDESKGEIAKIFTESGHSRLPVYEETIDDIIGIIHHKDFYTDGGITEHSVREIMTKPIFIPPTLKISNLLKLLQKEKTYMAVVTDEYGGTTANRARIILEIYQEIRGIVISFPCPDPH